MYPPLVVVNVIPCMAHLRLALRRGSDWGYLPRRGARARSAHSRLKAALIAYVHARSQHQQRG